MKFDFTDQVVMVTGASRGIGREIARRFADSGARVVVHFHKNNQAAEQTLADLPGKSHMMVSADLADSDDVGKMAEEVHKEVGKIDVLVNNAGVYEFHPVAATGFDDKKLRNIIFRLDKIKKIDRVSRGIYKKI